MKPFVVLLIIITGLFVNAYAAPPIISTISPQETSEDISVRIPFTITADTDITSVVLSSSNEELIPNVNLLYDSDGSHYTMVATPSFNAIGVVTITISVADADTNTVETSFILTVTDIDDSMYYWNNYQAASQILATNLRYPAGVAVDPNTNKIFVTDTGNNRVLRFSSDDHITPEAIFGDTESYTMNNPMGIHVDTFGHLWVADKDNNRVLRFDHASSKSSQAPPNGVLGQGEFTNYTGTSINTMRTPSDVWIDPTGTLWVADSENHRILRFDHAASKPNGANADAVIGQPNYTSMTYGLSQSKMNTPRAIVINQGHLFVADFSNSRVLCYKNAASKSFLDPADMVLGQPNFETNKKQITATGMDLPSGLGIDSNGRLYVSEQSNNRVLIFDDAANKSNGDAANTVLGQAGFIYNKTGTSNQSLIAPYCLNYDPPNKHLWVPDLMNNRVMRFDLNLKKPPVIGHIDNPTITENTISDPITFTVTDDNYQSLTIAYAYSNSNLLTSTSFSFKGPQVTSLENAVTVLATPVDTCITLNLSPQFEKFGTSTVTITVTDPHGMQDTRIFTANVLEFNDPPTVSSIQNQTIDEDAQSGAIHFTVADIEGNRLHIQVDASNKDLFPSNADNITLSNTDGGNTYMLTTDADTDILTLYLRPASDQSGTSTITITVNDGINDTHTAFHMTVTPQNDCPIITPIDNQIMLEDTISSAIALTVSDPDATGITIVVVSSNHHVIPSDAHHITLSHAHGKSFSLTTNAASVPLTLQLLPAMNQYGSSVITISVTDGVFSTSQSFTMTVESVNDPPLISPIANQLILEDTQMTGIPFSVTDIDSAPLHIEIETTNAQLIPSDPNHITLYNASGETGYTLLANSFDQLTLSVMPSPDANGMAKITVRVTGGTSDATESFTLTVIPENDAPAISTIHNQSTLEETVSTIPFAVTDVDGDPLTITVRMENPILIPSDGHHITLQTIDNSHFYSLVTHSGGETVILSILPALNQVGMSSISISVTDGQRSVSTSFGLTVLNINDPPTLSMIAPQSTLEDSETGSIEFSVFDADADRLTIEVGSGNSELIPANADHITLSNGSDSNSYTLATHAGDTLSLTLMPSLNVFGNTVISITVTDGIAQSIRSFTLTVTPVNDAPIISPIAHQTLLEDHLSSPIAFYVADIESNPLTIDIQSTNEHLIATHKDHITLQNAVTGNSYTLATDPGPLTLTLFPNWNQIGISEIVINATDGMDVSSHSFQVTVTEINDLPTLSAIKDQTILEDTTSDPISFTIADVDASLLTVNILSHNEMIVPSDAQHITLWNDNGGKDLTVTTQAKTDQLTLTVLPAANQTGSLSMTAYVFDGYSSVSRSFTVSILPVNDPPVIAVGDSFTAIEDMPDISIPFTATDLEDPACSLAITLISSNPTILPSQNLSWACHANMYTITANSLQDQHGSLDITILAKDHQGLSHTKTVPLNLIPVNDPPYIKTPETIRVKRNMVTDVLGIVISDVDAANNPMTVSLTVNDGLLLMNQQMNTAFSITGNLTVINATLGTIAYSPANNALGFRAITITANDRGHSGDGGPQWTITEIPIDIHNENVGPVNYLPTMSMKEDECLHITPISVFDLDAESNPLWVTLSTTNGYLSLSDINGVTLVAGQYQSATRITLAGSQQHINLALEQLTLTCTSHFNGWVQLTMTTNDLGHSGDSYSPLSATNSVPITVFAVIDPPTHQIPLALTTTEDAAIAFTAAVLDPDGEDVIAVTLEVDTGTLQLNSGKGLSGYLSTASFLSFTGIKSDINHAMTGIIFTPPANVYGRYDLQITYNDQDFQPTVVTVPLTILGLNDPPTIDHLSDTMIINEDTSITLTTAVDDIEAGIHDIQVTLHTEHGLLQLQEYAGLIVVPSETAQHLTITGSINAINNSLKAFHFIPTDNYHGETVVAIEVNDLGHTPMPAESDHASISIVIKSVNDSPVFALNTNNISVDEDFSTPQVITINTNAPVFGESDALTYTLSPDLESITWAAITFHPEAGRITITAIANEHGTQTFVITADDGEPENNLFSHSFLLNIAPVNDPPVFTLSTNPLVLKEDFSSVHTVSLTPSVIPWDEPKSITYTINPQSLTWVNLSINSETGDITIAKVSNGHGEANIGVMADNGLITATQSLSIIIESINDVPQITSHTHFSITENTAIGTEVYTISAIDADTDSLTYAIISISPADAFGISPKTGNIWIKSDLDFESIHSYSLTIAVSDPVTSVEQTITVTITDTNDAPIISNVPEETQVIFKEDVLHIPVMTVEDTDLGSLPLQLTLIAENGRVSLTDTGLTLESGNYSSTALSVSGTITAVNHALYHLTFMPAENYKGPASLFVQITDSAQSDMGKARSISTLIHIDVLNYNQPPIFTEYPGHTICDEDQRLTQTIVIFDEDARADEAIQFTLIAYNASVTLSDSDQLSRVFYLSTIQSYTGTIAAINAALDGLIVIPSSEFSGTAGYTIYANDWGHSGVGGPKQAVPASITITYKAINDPPEIAYPPQVTGLEDADIPLTLTVSDVDAYTHAIHVQLTSVNGLMTLANTADLFFQDNDVMADADYSFTGTIDNINNAMKAMIFHPTADFVGETSLTITVNDLGYSIPNGLGPAKTDTKALTITVTNVNDAPEILSISLLSVDEDAFYSSTIMATDIDLDGVSFTAKALPSWLKLTDNGDNSASLQGIPKNAHVGVNGPFMITVTDPNQLSATQSYTIVVHNTNDAPAFVSSPLTQATEDHIYNYTISVHDMDGDDLSIHGNVLSHWLQLTDHGNGTANLVGIPGNEQVGITNVAILTVSDGIAAPVKQAFLIVVENTNDPPEITSMPVLTAIEDTEYQYLLSAYDMDKDSITFIPTILPEWLSLNNTGGNKAIIYGRPLNDHVGISDPIIITARDPGHATATQSFTIKVLNTNDSPIFLSEPVTTATEDSLYQYTLIVQDVDIGASIRIYKSILSDWLTLDDHGDGTAVLSGTPCNEHVGIKNAAVINATDGIDKAIQQSFMITVANTNDSPEIISLPVLTATEDELYAYTVIAQDMDGDILSFTAQGVPSWLTLLDHGNNTASLQGIPLNENVGVSIAFTVTVNDPDNADFSQSFSITVTNTNDAPVFMSTPNTTAIEDSPYTDTVHVQDVDMGAVISIHATSLPLWLTLNDHGNGTATITGTPLNANVGMSDMIVLTASDGIASAVSQAFMITVINTNDTPVITSAAVLTATEDAPYIYKIMGDDMDGDRLSFVADMPSWLTIINYGNNTATLQGIPENNDVGLSTPLIVTARDPDNAFAKQEFTIQVINTNDAPVFISIPKTTAIEDSIYSYTLTVHDIDMAHSINMNAVFLPEWLMFKDNGDGTANISGIPLNDHVGTSDPVIIIASDGIALPITQTFSITVANTNDGPSITSQAVHTATEDTFYTYTITAHDMDDDILSFQVDAPLWLSLTHHGNNIASLHGVPSNDDVGLVPIRLTAMDPDKATAFQSFSLTVKNTNDAPTFHSSPLTTAIEDQSYGYTIVVKDIDRVSKISIKPSLIPYWLSFSDNGNGKAILTGKPQNSHVGDYPVVITATDGIAPAIFQAFTITVLNTNDPPEIVSPAIQSVDEDTLYRYHVSGEDIDGDSLTFTALGLPSWLTFTSMERNTALLQGIPTNDDVGTTPTITLTAVDPSHATATQSFTIVVNNTNDAPAFAYTPTLTAIEDRMYTDIVYVKDIDAEDFITISASRLPEWMSLQDHSDGTASISGIPLNAHVGSNVVVVTASDGMASTIYKAYFVKVSNTNDPPIIVSSAILTANEDESYTYLIKGFDMDGDNMHFSASSLPRWLILKDNGNGTAMLQGMPQNDDVGLTEPLIITVIDPDHAIDRQSFQIQVKNTNDQPVFVSSPISMGIEDIGYSHQVKVHDIDIDASIAISASSLPTWLTLTDNGNGTANLKGKPLNAHVGINAVVITASDGIGQPITQVFEITVTNTNDAPKITSSIVSIAYEDALYACVFQAEDVDSQDPVAFTASNLPSWLRLIDYGNKKALLEGIPTNDDVGETALLTITARDLAGISDSRSFTILVENTNDPPEISAIPSQLAQEYAFTEPIPFTIADMDGDALAISISSSNTRVVALDSNHLTLCGQECFAGASIELPETTECQPFYLSVLPVKDGVASLTITVTDGHLSARAAFDLTVTNVNIPPTIEIIPDTTIVEDVQGHAIPFTIADADCEGRQVTVTVLTDNPTVLPTNSDNVSLDHMGLIYGVTVDHPVDMSLYVSPLHNQSGRCGITITVTDANGAQASAHFEVIVQMLMDDPPVLSQMNHISIIEDTHEYKTYFSVRDPDGGKLLIEAQSSNTSLVSNDHIVVNQSMLTPLAGESVGLTLTMIPSPDANGTAMISIIAKDEAGHEGQRTFLLTITPVDDAPVIGEMVPIVLTEDTQNYLAAFTIFDADGGLLKIDGNSDNTQVIDNSDIMLSSPVITIAGVSQSAQLTLSTQENASGTAKLTLVVTDAAGLTDTTTIDITINPVNDPPQISSIDDQFTNEDQPGAPIGLKISDAEPGQLRVLAQTSSPKDLPVSCLSFEGITSEGFLNISFAEESKDLTLVITPLDDVYGRFIIKLTVYDRDGLQDSTLFRLTVLPVNDMPKFDLIHTTIEMNEDAPPQIIKNWITGISNGAVNESDDLAFNISIENNHLFSVQPHINISGTTGSLEFTPAENAHGQALISLSLTDGYSETRSKSFTITITPVNDIPVLSPIAGRSTFENQAFEPIPLFIGDVDDERVWISVLTEDDFFSGISICDGNDCLLCSEDNCEMQYICQSKKDYLKYAVTILKHLTHTPHTLNDDIQDIDNNAKINLVEAIYYINQVSSGLYLQVTPRTYLSGSQALTVVIWDMDGEQVSQSTWLSVTPVSNPPTLTVYNANGIEDSPIPVPVSVSAVDLDSEELLDIIITGVPDGASLNKGRKSYNEWILLPSDLNHLQLLPAINSSDDIVLSIKAGSQEKLLKRQATVTKEMQIDVVPVADAPVVELASHEVTGMVGAQIPITFNRLKLMDTDGSEEWDRIEVLDCPETITFSKGNMDGDRLVIDLSHETENDLSGWDFSVTSSSIGTYAIGICAYSKERENGDVAKAEDSVQVVVFDSGGISISGADEGGGCFISIVDEFH